MDGDFVKNVLQNVSLDTNIAVNFYLPTSEAILSVKDARGTELLNTENTVTIQGTTYYVITTEQAPKDAYRESTLTVTLESGRAYQLDASILRYAKNLFAITRDDAYIKDAQALVRYILNYIRECALAYGGATAEELTEYQMNLTIDKTLRETIYENPMPKGIDSFCLDLQTTTGMVFQVEADFVGSVAVSLYDRTLTEVYTADTPMEERYLILDNIAAYQLRTDITLTVTDSEGNTERALFNLATYVKSIGSDALYAVYAYSIEAASYHKNYPTVQVVK